MKPGAQMTVSKVYLFCYAGGCCHRPAGIVVQCFSHSAISVLKVIFLFEFQKYISGGNFCSLKINNVNKAKIKLV